MEKGDLKIVARKDRGHRLGNNRMTLLRSGGRLAGRDYVLEEESFHAMLTLERRRAERSRKPFVLMLLDSGAVRANGHRAFVERLTSIVCDATRQTDLIGWYESGSVLAVIFTEVSLEGENPVAQILHSKIVRTVQENLDPKLTSKMRITLHMFPEDWKDDKGHTDRVADSKLYPDLSRKDAKKHFPMALKRGIDIIGSALLLLLLSPILGAISLAIKLTSKGSVIFQQDRLGEFGKQFKCLKFRTMYTDNDQHLHREYVQNFIAGKTGNETGDGNEPAVFKIKNDPRVTPIGRFLRKTSLDELPQFWNVLRGEMSLVGPRPPVPYEFEVYDFWHRRRVLEVKPGVTGLWQVTGRSRTCFDDMVRLDLRYSQSWSIWLDLRILLATPRAVFMGDGAF